MNITLFKEYYFRGLTDLAYVSSVMVVVTRRVNRRGGWRVRQYVDEFWIHVANKQVKNTHPFGAIYRGRKTV